MAVAGDPNASIPTVQPRVLRDMYYGTGMGVGKSCITFVSTVAYENGIKDELGLKKQVLPVHGVRNLRKQDMKLNGETPKIEVDPQTYIVTADGVELKASPAEDLPMTQRYFLF